MPFWNDLSFSKKLGSGYAVILIFMVIIAIVVSANLARLVESSRWVNHTYDVIRVAESLAASKVDMETGLRGFLVTGDDEYLEPYHSGKKRFHELVAEGQKLTSDNPVQVKRWQQVEALSEQWLKQVAEPEIAARRQVAEGAAALANFRQVSGRTVGKDIFDNMRVVHQRITNLLVGSPAGQHLATRILLDLVNMETGQRGYLLTGQDASLAPFNDGQASLKSHLSELSQYVGSTDLQQADINELNGLVNNWLAEAANKEIAARRAMNQHKVSIENVIGMMRSGDGKKLMDMARAKIQEIVEAEEKLISVRAAEQVDISDTTAQVSFGGTLIALIFGVVIAFAVTRSVLTPIKHINQAVTQMSDGDLTDRLTIQSNDELGQMGRGFNLLSEHLQSSLTDISDATGQLATSAEQLSATTIQTRDGINQQKDETEQVAAAINEMSATAHEVLSSASQASSAASEANAQADSGNQVVNEAISSISDLAQDIESSAAAIEQLKEDSNNIGTVIDVIKNIAEQTNLLALNAAIEAARAGEQGRGFAVVADEVRTLAQRTQTSTTEIESLIEGLQSRAQSSFDAMNKSRENTHGTVDKARSAGQALMSITEAVSTILQMNTHIATAAKEQNEVAESINQSIVNISHVSEQNSAAAEQTSAASRELAQLGNKLEQVVKQFKV